MSRMVGVILVCICATVCQLAHAAGLDKFVSGSFQVDYETKVLSYGLPDSDDPNFLPYGELRFFDHLSFGSRFYIDTSRIEERMGRGDCSWD